MAAVVRVLKDGNRRSLERYSHLAWSVPAAALFVWLSALAFVLPYDPDEAVYKIIATGIVHGHWPYRDLFDHKPPLIYAWYLPAGLGASINVERVIAAATIALSVRVFAGVAQRWLSGRQVMVATWSYALFLANPFLLINANTEAFALLPLTASMAATTPFLSGIFLGVAVMTMPTALPFVVLAFVAWKRKAWRTLAGMAMVGTAVSLPFIPIWRAFLDANLLFNLDYGRTFSYAARLRDALSIDPAIVAVTAPLWAGAVVGVAMNLHGGRWYGPATMASAVVAAKGGGFHFSHYYLFFAPPVALLASEGLSLLWRRRALRIVLSLAAAFGIALAYEAVDTAAGNNRYKDVTAAIRSEPGELFVLGGSTQIYTYASKQPQRRFFFDVPLAVRKDWGVSAEHELLTCPPDVLVVPGNGLFKLGWVGDVEAGYRNRREFANATLLTDPNRLCGHGGTSR